MTYLLYYAPGACSMAAHIVLEELAVPFELEVVSVTEGATLQPAYLAINPKGRVPALRIGGEPRVLTELPVILAYLARTHPAGALLPTANTLDEARCHEWLAWLSGWVHGTGYGEVWRPQRFIADTARFGEIMTNGRDTIVAAYAVIERAFADDGRQWAVASGYSIVDPLLLVLYCWGRHIGLQMRTDYPAWAAHAERMLMRPAVQRVIEREGVHVDA
ncbi:glutathione S-transferase N-terminal domain-containing protein [Paraburkholderia bryophila]|uniref:glutathione S-transferase family protein n=1 Tax=Paraburkholderia bryophila TaxID=420952 RepID=UPI00234ACC4A|nr:glutathione S-transferase N-terminal domain-containing protein [Paraburkholderia bryophila]WCM23478.1 glutathione S-transferase N-terminal domain-containing protein [Paraburkholderia bryophila]